jgi:hypothetical protein
MGLNEQHEAMRKQPAAKRLGFPLLAVWAILLFLSGSSTLGWQVVQNGSFEGVTNGICPRVDATPTIPRPPTLNFEGVPSGIYTRGHLVAGWLVCASEVSVVTDPNFARTGSNYLALATGRLRRTFSTMPGVTYELLCCARSPGLTDWWPADDTPVDIVGTNDGTIPYNDVAYDFGKLGRGFTFSGATTNDYGNEVDFGTNAGNFGTNDFTIDCWIKIPHRATNGAGYSLLEKRQACNGTESMWDIHVGPVPEWNPIDDSVGVLSFEVCDVNEQPLNNFVSNPDHPINDGVFHHAAWIRHGLNLAIYIDGILSSNITTAEIANLSNSVPMRAGNSVCYEYGNGGIKYPFVGEVDELDLWQRALSPAEVHAIYAAGSLGKYSYYSLYPNFQVATEGIATNTVTITDFAGGWQIYTNSFIATGDRTTIELSGNTLSVLLDDIRVSPMPRP